MILFCPKTCLSMIHALNGLVAGVVSGTILSLPVTGPMGIYITAKGIEGKMRQGVITASGIACVETLYCFIAFIGVSYYQKFTFLRELLFVAGAAFVMILGIRLFRKNILPSPGVQSHSALNQIGSFFIGCLTTAVNPAVFFSWLVVFALFARYGVVFSFPADISFSVGVGLGCVLWFTIYLRFIMRIRNHLNLHRLQNAVKILSVVLIGFGAYMMYTSYHLLVKYIP